MKKRTRNELRIAAFEAFSRFSLLYHACNEYRPNHTHAQHMIQVTRQRRLERARNKARAIWLRAAGAA